MEVGGQLVLELGVKAGLVQAVLLTSERGGEEDGRDRTYGRADEVGGGIGRCEGAVSDAGEADKHRDEVKGG